VVLGYSTRFSLVTTRFGRNQAVVIRGYSWLQTGQNRAFKQDVGPHVDAETISRPAILADVLAPLSTCRPPHGLLAGSRTQRESAPGPPRAAGSALRARQGCRCPRSTLGLMVVGMTICECDRLAYRD